jgi:hypothetical protein
MLDLNEGDHSAASAAPPINPVDYDLFPASEFDLRSPLHDPIYGPNIGPYWR